MKSQMNVIYHYEKGNENMQHAKYSNMDFLVPYEYKIKHQ